MTTTTPTITIYVRHSTGCKYAGDEFAKRCDCRKWLRWTPVGGDRQRKPAQTRSWAEAEQVKRDLEDQLSGRAAPVTQNDTKEIRSAVKLFLTSKRTEGVSTDVMKKYERELGRLASFCEDRDVFVVSRIDLELVTLFTANWDELYPSSVTRNKMRERYKSFMKFCVNADWLRKVPEWPKMVAKKPDTKPLSPEEFGRLLDSVYVVVRAPENAVIADQTHDYWVKRVRGLFLLMRHSGLSIQDALTLPKTELEHGSAGYRIVTKREKTGTDVSVLLPPDIAAELLAVPNDNDRYFFWSGVGAPKSICGNWGKRFIAPCFKEAGIEGGHMKAHRLRDTLACELLMAGVSMEHVSKILAHDSIRTTEKSYAKWVPGRQEVLDKAVVSAWGAAATKAKKRPGRARAA